MRTFISLNLDDKTQKIISEYKRNFRNLLDDKDIRKIKWEPEDKYHITLFFIGDITENLKEKLIDELNSIKELKIGRLSFKLKDINAFPNMRNPRVLFAEATDNDGKSFLLSKYVQKIMLNLGFRQDKKFQPHITLGRIRKNENVNFENINIKCKNEEFIISDLFLMKSTLAASGSRFEEILKIKL